MRIRCYLRRESAFVVIGAQSPMFSRYEIFQLIYKKPSKNR
jgi:hypothetical protein